MADQNSSSTGRASPRQYPPELKERAIRMVLDSIDRGEQRQGLVTRIARQLDIGPESLRRWVQQAEIDRGQRAGTTTEEAQFNTAWPLALFILDGEIGPSQMLEHRFDDEQVRELVGKIELLESDELNELHRRAVRGELSGKYAASVTITMKDGQQFASGIVDGGIRYPQGWDENRVEEKFRWLVDHVLEDSRIEPLVDMVWHFEDVDDVRELTQLVGSEA